MPKTRRRAAHDRAWFGVTRRLAGGSRAVPRPVRRGVARRPTTAGSSSGGSSGGPAGRRPGVLASGTNGPDIPGRRPGVLASGTNRPDIPGRRPGVLASGTNRRDDRGRGPSVVPICLVTRGWSFPEERATSMAAEEPRRAPVQAPATAIGSSSKNDRRGGRARDPSGRSAGPERTERGTRPGVPDPGRCAGPGRPGRREQPRGGAVLAFSGATASGAGGRSGRRP